jgi:hypothetical protein
VLIFVFAGVSCGRTRLILAEFAPVPNAPSESDSSPVTATPAVAVSTAGGAQSTAIGAWQSMRAVLPAEFGGPQGPEPTRFGDWEKNGRCVDF